MIDFSLVRSRERAFDLLDTYAATQRQSVKKKDVPKDTGIIKSYMIERALDEPLDSVFRGSQFHMSQIDDDFFNVNWSRDHYGFLEVLEARYLMFHSVKITEKADRPIQRAVSQAAGLDFVWLPGYFLNRIWDVVIKPQYAHRFVKMRFEYNDIFRETSESDETTTNGTLGRPSYAEDEDGLHWSYRRQSNLSIGMTASKIADVLIRLQSTLEDFKVMTRLRMPSSQVKVGGYDFWDWGKLSYHSPSFRDGRVQALGLLQTYRQATELIEKIAWFQAERTEIRGAHEAFTLTGAPVTFRFPKPLDLKTFHNFVNIVFESKRSSFRLWGNPIPVSENKFHVFGIDLHLWQRIYMELTPEWFIVVLPKHTCGNTVHRLVNNIQHFLCPDVEVFIGDYTYDDVILDALLSRGAIQ